LAGSSSLSTRAKATVEMKKIRLYLEDVYNELMHKVSWPTWAELQSSAIVVMVASLIIALIVFAMDFSFKGLMQMIYSMFY
jgi:preprotein translocase subunit SecE